MHYRQLMTLDIGNDALLCKVFLPAYKGRPSHGFIAYLLTLGLDLSEQTHPREIVVGDVPSIRIMVIQRRCAHQSGTFKTIPPLRHLGVGTLPDHNLEPLGPRQPQSRYKLY
ncbi:hypothetical protein AAG906_000093 [Vitis piasezkii]